MRSEFGIALVLAVVCVAWNSATAQTTTTVEDGGSVTTAVGFDAAINHGSTLHRRWVTLHNAGLAIDIKGNTGMRTETAAQGVEGYVGRASLVVSAKEEVSAYEIRIILFNVWGDFLRTYSLTRVSDLAAGENRVEARWHIFDESEVGYVYSIAYVSRVLTHSGRIYSADDDAVMSECRKLCPNMDRKNLTPKNEIWLGGAVIGNSEISR